MLYVVGFAARSAPLLMVLLFIDSCRYRTKISDPDFTDDLERINEIPRKSFGALVAKNMTDVCPCIELSRIILKSVSRTVRTHQNTINPCTMFQKIMAP